MAQLLSLSYACDPFAQALTAVMTDEVLYTDLTKYYELMCSGINYQEQCEYAQRLHQLFGIGGDEYLDLACGHGPHLKYFAKYGYRATGLDANQQMLDRAAESGIDVEFSCQDMSCFSFDRPFNLITCFLYSILYAYPQRQFENTLKSVYQALKPGGVFCFDAVDKNQVANDEGFSHQLQDGDDKLLFQSRWQYSGSGERLDLHIDIAREAGEEINRWQDKHSMLAIDIPTIKHLLEALGFEVHIMERDFSKIVEWQGENGNVFFVCVKTL
ncbi:MAG: SAM-dependent methyltransferase [Alteromonadaceae bacterium]|nr:MAG: SAM-dependent methyltransferase [Alteromonadaceae bacterium]